MSEPKMTALQWADIPHINEIEDISVGDRACLAEIRDVLAEHERLHRFGVALLHHHFHLADDEILVEHCDERNRTLSVRTVSHSQVDRANLIETIWRFDNINGTECKRYCPKDDYGEHAGYPDHSGAAS